MKTVLLHYGNTMIECDFNSHVPIQVIKPNPYPTAGDPKIQIEQALRNPLGLGDLGKFHQAKSIGIAINDQSRPVPHSILLPILIKYLNNITNSECSLRFFIATGTHEPLNDNSFHLTVPNEVLNAFHVSSHDCDEQENLVYLGETTRKTPVWINKKFMECDIKIAVGDIEPHHFMGYSGGAKSIVIGLAGRKTITANHRWLLDENAHSGKYEGNPIREDVEEMGDIVGVDACLNAVLTLDKQIAAVFWGSPRIVMQMGIPLVENICMVKVEKKFDLLIASAGGHPKDINLYQAQKALTHACMLANPNATVVLVAACPDGMGSKGFEDLLTTSKDMSAVINKFSEMPFTLGPHKAYQLARQAMKNSIYLLSEMNSAFVQQCHIQPLNSLKELLEQMRAKNSGHLPSTAVLPYATSTIPIFK